MKDILDTAMSSSYLDQNLEIDSEKLESFVSNGIVPFHISTMTDYYNLDK
jgi:hypothetical protein